MKYVHLEETTNKILGWYDDSIHSKIPTPSIEIMEEDWQKAIDINANCYDGKKFIIKDLRTEDEIIQAELQTKLNEAQYLLDSTEFKFNDDYDLKYTPEWLELKIKRQKAREFIRANSYDAITNLLSSATGY